MQGSLKTEYTLIDYVPVAGAKASATSAVRHEIQANRRSGTFLISFGLYERFLPACKCWIASSKAMKATGLMILLYGAAGGPGGGSTPMELIRNQPVDVSHRALALLPQGCVANMGHIVNWKNCLVPAGQFFVTYPRKGGNVIDEGRLALSQRRCVLR